MPVRSKTRRGELGRQQACRNAYGGRSQQTALSSAPHVIAVNPDLVMVMPRPMPRCPNVVNGADIVTWPVDVIWPVTNFDVGYLNDQPQVLDMISI